MKKRPRLADHALARRHLRDGEAIAVVHDARSGALFQLPPRLLDLVLCADGTRDLEGIGLAASRAGLFESLDEIAELVDELDGLGLIDEGVEPAPARSDALRYETPADDVDADRPLEHLEGYAFACSGRGACCRQYGSVALTADDVARGHRAGFEALPGDVRGQVLLPLYGGVRTERVAMTLVDGRCLQLTSAGRCGLEERGDASSKPVACRVYPATLVDDGERVRVSVGCECDCVFESLDGKGAALVSGERVRDLPAGMRIVRLSERVVIATGRTVAREAFSRWSRDRSRDFGSDRVPERLVELAKALESSTDGQELPAPASAGAGGAGVRDVLFDAVARFAERMEGAAAAADEWRSTRDRTRITRRAVARAARKIAANRALYERTLVDSPRARDEAFAVRAALFGHHFGGDETIAAGLVALAARLLTARRLGEDAPELGHPIAAVLAAARGALV